jgi:hypothetical protein
MHRKRHQFKNRVAPHFALVGGVVVPTYPHYASWMYPLWNYGGGYTSTTTGSNYQNSGYIDSGQGWTAQDGGGAASDGGGGDGGGSGQ